MAKLKLYHQGQLLKELELNSGEEYFAGRSSQCQFVLDENRGISRQHVRIAYENDAWTVTLMSRFGGLLCGGKPVEQIRLDGDVHFSIAPYEFEFKFANESHAEQAAVSKNLCRSKKKPATRVTSTIQMIRAKMWQKARIKRRQILRPQKYQNQMIQMLVEILKPLRLAFLLLFHSCVYQTVPLGMKRF
jgi:predicted component of type VI protein secretion system